MQVNLIQTHPVMQELAEVIGEADAIKLGQAMGGARIYFPKQLPEDHPLLFLIGAEKAEQLCHYYQGDTLEIPSKKLFRELRNSIIRRDYTSMETRHGSKADLLAIKYGLSRRQILNITRH